MYFREEQMFLLSAKPSIVIGKDGSQPPTPAFFGLKISMAISLVS